MDKTSVIVIAIFAVISVAAFLVFRMRAKVEVKGPLNTGLTLDASNEPPAISPAIKIEGAKSRGGGLIALDGTGRGADVRGVDVETDIRVSSDPSEGPASPKA
ncbi:MAG TPA: hypothetical protein VN937_20745 [Blastocatellia bacterium]|nr:hypothetical protein [Blastocatellia bacterium]